MRIGREAVWELWINVHNCPQNGIFLAKMLVLNIILQIRG